MNEIKLRRRTRIRLLMIAASHWWQQYRLLRKKNSRWTSLEAATELTVLLFKDA